MDNSKKTQPQVFSPLKSPTLQRHLCDNIDINYPEQFLSRHHQPYAKQLLIGSDGYFRCAVNVHDFGHDEVVVSTNGHTLLIKAAHEEKEDEHGPIARNFTKKYVLPYNLDVEKTSAWISKEILYVKIPPKTESLAERIVGIKLQ